VITLPIICFVLILILFFALFDTREHLKALQENQIEANKSLLLVTKICKDMQEIILKKI